MLRKGSNGAEVAQLHQALIESGYPVAQDDLDESFFGGSTDGAVRDFQQSHVGQDGKPLKADGIVGPRTLWALAHPGAEPFPTPDSWKEGRPSPEVAAVCQAARGDVGLRESPDGSNDGPDLKKFQTRGRPWCALAVSYWYSKFPGGSPFGTRASVYSIRDWALPRKAVVMPTEAVEPGDLALILRSGGRGHVGLIVGVDGNELSTVEGNASNCVRAMLRERSKLSMVVRPSRGR